MDPMMNLVWESFPLLLAQILRGFCIAVAPFCIILSIQFSWSNQIPTPRKILFGGLSMLVLSAMYTQIERWDDPATPRLFVATAGIGSAFVGLWMLRKTKGVV